MTLKLSAEFLKSFYRVYVLFPSAFSTKRNKSLLCCLKGVLEMPDFVRNDRYLIQFLIHVFFLYSYVALAMDTKQLGNNVRIFADETEPV